MTSNGKLPPAERRDYKHVFDGLRQIYSEGGIKGLGTGLKPATVRAVVVNVSQVVSYTQTKESLLNNGLMEDNIKCHVVSSVVSGLVLALAACPIDVVKTRIQFMKSGQTADPLYTGIFDALDKTVRKEGVTALWKGLTPFYARCAPYTILLFVFSEALTNQYRKIFGKNQSSTQ